MSRRPYEQRLRAEAADATRERILDALYERLGEGPVGPVSVDEVARRARVARSTVYLAFGSRGGLFDALTERLLGGEGYDRILEATRHPDARETLRGGLEGGVRMFAAHHEVFRVLYAIARIEPDSVGEALARSERRRWKSMDWLAGRLSEQGLLRPDVTPARAADVIWLLAGFEAFDQLASGRGLDPDEVVEVLVQTAESALLS